MSSWLLLPQDDGAIVSANDGRAAAAFVRSEASAVALAASDVPWESAQGLRTVVWSGAFPQSQTPGKDAEAALWEADPRTWSSLGWSALEQALARPGCAGRLILRPHARHVISDIPSCRKLLTDGWGMAADVQLLIDPASMLTREMAVGASADDHLRRIFEAAMAMEPSRIFGVLIGGWAEDARVGIKSIPLSAQGGDRAARIVRIASEVLAGVRVESRPKLVLHRADFAAAGGFAQGLEALLPERRFGS